MHAAGSGPAPKEPFEGWPRHLFDPAFGHCWWVERAAAIVTQTTNDYGHLEGATRMSDWIDAALEHEREALAAAGGLLIVHDWRSLGGYDSRARVLVNERVKRRPKGYARQTTCILRPTPLWRMALTVTDLAYALLGIPPAVVTGDPERAVRRLEGATPGAVPRWLAAFAPA